MPNRTAIVMLAAAACSGTIGVPPSGRDHGSRDEPPMGGSSGTPPIGTQTRGAIEAGVLPACAKPGAVGSTPLRRLTRLEYDNSVRDLLNVAEPASAAFPPDEVWGGFANNAGAPITRAALDAYLKAAASIAARATERTTSWLGCDRATMGTDACARTFITSFGRRAYRRPLDPAEVDRLFTVFTEKKNRSDFLGGIRLVLTTMLSSPNFLYRAELGSPSASAPGTRGLDGYEIASRLSYLFWASVPDEELLAAAASGRLAAVDGIAAEARRMLRDAKADAAFASFFAQWLGLSALERLEKDDRVFPQFTPELRRAMQGELASTVAHHMKEGDATLASLLLSRVSFINQPLAALYGVEGGATAAEIKKVDLPAAERAGLLTRAAFLASGANTTESSPIRRGLFVRVNLLCQSIAPPPPNVDATLPPPTPGLTLRARLSEHRKNPACAGCHDLMDPPGLAFERYDAIGAYRTSEAGHAIDATGELTSTVEADGPFDGPIELSRRLAPSVDLRACAAKQWFRYALARDPEAEDGCSLAQAYSRFSDAGFDLRELLLALVGSDAFRFDAAR